jgi:hypothetical protein
VAAALFELGHSVEELGTPHRARTNRAALDKGGDNGNLPIERTFIGPIRGWEGPDRLEKQRELLYIPQSGHLLPGQIRWFVIEGSNRANRSGPPFPWFPGQGSDGIPSRVRQASYHLDERDNSLAPIAGPLLPLCDSQEAALPSSSPRPRRQAAPGLLLLSSASPPTCGLIASSPHASQAGAVKLR